MSIVTIVADRLFRSSGAGGVMVHTDLSAVPGQSGGDWHEARRKQALDALAFEQRGITAGGSCAVKDGSFESQFGRWPTNLGAWQVRRKAKTRKTA